MSNQSLRDQILRRVRGNGPGHVFTPKDFLDLGTRGSVDRVLSEAVDDGDIRRIARGVYHYPKFNATLGIEVAPSADQIAQALARKVRSRATPSGAQAANQLGLSTQVPAKLTYLTDGNDRTVKAGKRTFVFKHVSPKDFDAERSKPAMILRALRYLGKDKVDQDAIDHLRQGLTRTERRELLQRSAYMTDWLREAARKISQEEAVSHG